MIAAIAAPVALVLWYWGESILRIIGADYIHLELLRLILISIIPYSINMISSVYLRVHLLLKELIALSGLMAGSVIGLAYGLGATTGGTGLALGWLLGQSVAAGGILVYFSIRRLRPGRRL